MNKIIITIATIISFLFTSNLSAQKQGDEKTQKEVFGTQPMWKALVAADTYEEMLVSGYYSVKTSALFWNAGTGGMAKVEKFFATDTILVVHCHDGNDYIYKKGCTNRLKFIRSLDEDGPKPVTRNTVTIIDTVRVQVQPKTQHLDYSWTSTESGSQMKVYSEQNADGSNTGNHTVIKVQGEPQPLHYYQEEVRVYNVGCGCYVVTTVLKPVKIRDTHVITFGY